MDNMTDAEQQGEVRYQLSGRSAIAQAEAMGVILQHEKIDYKKTPGPNSTMAIIVKVEDKEKVERVIHQWYCEMHHIHKQVWAR